LEAVPLPEVVQKGTFKNREEMTESLGAYREGEGREKRKEKSKWVVPFSQKGGAKPWEGKGGDVEIKKRRGVRRPSEQKREIERGEKRVPLTANSR